MLMQFKCSWVVVGSACFSCGFFIQISGRQVTQNKAKNPIISQLEIKGNLWLIDLYLFLAILQRHARL